MRYKQADKPFYRFVFTGFDFFLYLFYFFLQTQFCFAQITLCGQFLAIIFFLNGRKIPERVGLDFSLLFGNADRFQFFKVGESVKSCRRDTLSIVMANFARDRLRAEFRP